MDNLNFISSINLNWLDIVLGFIFVIAVIRGLFVGFSRTISGLLGVICGFWVAANQYYFVSQKLQIFMKNEMWRDLLAFFLLFVVVYLVFAIAGIIIKGLFRVLRLSWMDRILGGAFGFLKALLISAIIIFILTLTLPDKSPLLAKSYLYPRVSNLSRIMTDMVPKDLKAKFMWKWRKIEMRFHRGRRESI